MSRLTMIDPLTATGKARDLLAAVKARLKVTPNMTRVMANSPAVLEAYLAFSGALENGALTARLREQLALTVAEADACEYCLSVHSAAGKAMGMTESELRDTRQGKAASARDTAALAFAREIVEKRGIVPEKAVTAVRAAGFSDGEIAEIITHVALNIFTNYFNNVAAVELDFPKVALMTA
ncbi:MAG TPA: carboxymuconolactone decarboxylase family protein [Candidatus Limnocylindrales bacterium]|nr:carboxymuconolactone decarboxylase family protein [Candidatus Limnocylindrales bacterium]